MGEIRQTKELHWAGLLWQRGEGGAYFLRDGKTGEEVEIELLFRTADRCERVIALSGAADFASAVFSLRQNIDADLEDMGLDEIAGRPMLAQDDLDAPIFAAVRALEEAIHKNSLKLSERAWRTQSGLSGNTHAANLETEYARAFIELVDLDVDKLSVRQTARLEHDCAAMRPSNIPINAELTKLANTLSKLQGDVAEVVEELNDIKKFAYPNIPHEQDVSPIMLASDLRYVLSKLERDALVERGSPHGTRRGPELERDQILKILTMAWLHWMPFGRAIGDIGFAPPTPSEGETMESLFDRLIPDSQSSGAASRRGVWDFLEKYFERLKDAKPRSKQQAEQQLWRTNPTAGASRDSVLTVRQDFLEGKLDHQILIIY